MVVPEPARRVQVVARYQCPCQGHEHRQTPADGVVESKRRNRLNESWFCLFFFFNKKLFLNKISLNVVLAIPFENFEALNFHFKISK